MKIISIIIILISFIAGIFLYPQMPDQMITHWNEVGEPDGYMSAFWGLFLMPIVSLGIFLLFLFIPKIDPLKKNFKSFEKEFNLFILLLIVFLMYVHTISVLWNLGLKFSMNQFIAPAFTILFWGIGIMVSKSKRNWFVGIRTPWTLSSDVVWEKTHKLGGLLFKIAGSLTLISFLFPEHAMYFILFPIILSALIPVIYSYFIYRKETV